ncbi:ComEA family DNA-binding protein [Psychrobacter sp.]|uniref:ComEA family DNA-binding protein n=1 Tax=Psychrobacter sp. TaxID=56811 RepID=UPI0025F32487|nr:ComEA family DNA-binding protein [Psychrobacter sp.]
MSKTFGLESILFRINTKLTCTIDYLSKFIQVLLLLLSLLLTNQALAKQCFADSNQAYRYLVEQQQAQEANLTGKNKIIDINQATEAELTTLKGIGSNKAQQIILYRQAFGEFKRIEELAKVKGIGEKTVANNKARLKVD